MASRCGSPTGLPPRHRRCGRQLSFAAGDISREEGLRCGADRRKEPAAVAVQALKRMATTLRDVITDSAPSASVSTGLEPW